MYVYNLIQESVDDEGNRTELIILLQHENYYSQEEFTEIVDKYVRNKLNNANSWSVSEKLANNDGFKIVPKYYF